MQTDLYKQFRREELTTNLVGIGIGLFFLICALGLFL